jgi:NADH-quinone oxidoreductase subunit M
MTHLLSLIVAAPAVAALLVLFLPAGARMAVRLVSLAGAIVSLVGSIVVAATYDLAAGGLQRVEDIPLVASLGIHLKLAVDGWGVSLLLLTGIIIVTGVLASWSVPKRDKDYFALLLVLVAGVFGVFVSQDLFVFFLFYEIAVLPMYLLIGIWGASHEVPPRGPFAGAWRRFSVGGKEYAAMKLTIMLLVGSAAILVAMFMMWHEAGGKTFDLGHFAATEFSRETQMWAFPLLWLGFGSRAGVVPFHTGATRRRRPRCRCCTRVCS